jgi:hypothetical protein
VILGLVGFVRKIVHAVRAVSGGDGTFAVQSFKFLSSRTRSGRLSGDGPAPLDCGRNVSRPGTERKESAKQQIDRNRGVRRFHLGDPRLTGLQALCQRGLGDFLRSPTLAKTFTERQFRFNERGLFRSQLQEVRG